MRDVFNDLLAVDGVRGVVFFTPSGEALDFRTSPPTFRNIKLTKLPEATP